MAMSLGADDLRKLADELDELAKLSFEVSDIKSGEHKVKLRRSRITSGDGENLPGYIVIGITDGEWSHGAMRDR